jgi:iron(III) transport system permease protein
MIFLQGISAAPVLFLMLGGPFMSIDPSLEEAAEASGMSKFQVFRKISLPLLKPAIIGGSLFVLMMSLSTFEVPALLGMGHIHVFATIMYDALQPAIGLPQYGVAGVYAIIMLIPTLAVLYYYQKMMKLSHQYATVTGKGYKPKLTDLGSWKWVGWVFVIGYFLIDLIFPFLAVVWTSLLPIIQMPSVEALGKINLNAYVKAFEALSSQGAIGNTIILVLTVGVVGMLIGLIISWITVRTKMPGRYGLDTIAMVPHVIPGIAIAFAVAFLTLMFAKYIPLYGTLAAIIIANIVRTTPFSTRTINAALIQIHPELEEAVQTSGGSKIVALRKVIMPLVTPSMMYCFIWAVLNSYKEVVLALFLISPRNMLISTVIWTQWYASANMNVAMALSVIMIVVMAIFVVTMLKVFPKIRKSM